MILLDSLVSRVQTRAETVPKLADEAESVVTRDELLLARRESGAEEIEARLLPHVLAFWRTYVQTHGWFYPSSDELLQDTVFKLSRTPPAESELSGKVTTGSPYLQARFRSFWDIDKGPVKGFDKGLEAVVRYRLGLNNSKDYTYTTASGETITGRETFDINTKNIRRGFVVQRKSGSFFKPGSAAALFRRWIPNTAKAPVVWDPSAGFGARLLGFASAFPGGTYLCNEPATRIASDVRALADELHQARLLAGWELSVLGSEFATFEEGSLDCVMTSPPYFDLEKYYDEPGQCWREYPTIGRWELEYLAPTLAAAHRGLKKGAMLILNVDSVRQEIVTRTAVAAGFTPHAEHRLTLGTDHFARKRSGAPATTRSEPILVFRK